MYKRQTLRHSTPLQGRLEAVLIVRCSDTEASDAALLELVVLSDVYKRQDLLLSMERGLLSVLFEVFSLFQNLLVDIINSYGGIVKFIQ